ncbi:Centromere/kinetochore protein zw10 [Chytriomyces hyalinus]|nr:Centromere/kinetochore protein zw10 [Chytriomyces hyalinus]
MALQQETAESIIAAILANADAVCSVDDGGNGLNASLDGTNHRDAIAQLQMLLQRVYIDPPAKDTDAETIDNASAIKQMSKSNQSSTVDTFAVNVGAEGLDACVQALDRRLADTRNLIHDCLSAHAAQHQQGLNRANTDLEVTLAKMKSLRTSVFDMLLAENPTLASKRAELAARKEEIRAAEIQSRLHVINLKVNAFKESVEACSIILSEFGDIEDAVDTLRDAISKLNDIDDCDEVVPKANLEAMYEEIRSLIVNRLEDAFSNVLVIQPMSKENNAVTVTTKSSVRISNPHTPSTPIFIQTPTMIRLIKSLNIHNTLYASLSRSLLKTVLQMVIMHPESVIESTLASQTLNGDIVQVGTLKIHQRVSGTTTAHEKLTEALSKLPIIFEFLSSTFFGLQEQHSSDDLNPTPPAELIQNLWPSLASDLIDNLLNPCIPTTSVALQTFPKLVTAPCVNFEAQMANIKWIPRNNDQTNAPPTVWQHLSGFCSSVETHYCNVRWETCMQKAREIILHDGFDIVPVGEGALENSNEPFRIESLSKYIKLNDSASRSQDSPGLNPIYPAGATGAEGLQWLTHFPPCSISVRAMNLLQVIRDILNEASDECVSAYCASRLYLLTRDILTLDLGLTPVKHHTRLQTLPQSALIYHNDCLYMAHSLMTLGVQYRHGLSARFANESMLKAEEVGYIDLSVMYRQAGMDMFNLQLRIQKTNLLELLANANGLGMGDSERSAHVQKVLAQVIHSVKKLCSLWAPPLAPTMFHLRLSASLVGWILDAVVEEVTSAIDIGDEESRKLHESLTNLEIACASVFVHSNGNEDAILEGRQRLSSMVPCYTKFKKTKEMMVMSFAGIMEMFRGGRGPEGMLFEHERGGLVEFSNDVLSRLVRALFSDTPLRQKNLAEIQTRRG